MEDIYNLINYVIAKVSGMIRKIIKGEIVNIQQCFSIILTKSFLICSPPISLGYYS